MVVILLTEFNFFSCFFVFIAFVCFSFLKDLLAQSQNWKHQKNVKSVQKTAERRQLSSHGVFYC